jgi:hypothetical protein
MGLEYFRSREMMLSLYQADREHFFFILGIIQ